MTKHLHFYLKKNILTLLFFFSKVVFSQTSLLEEIDDSVWSKWAKAKHVKEITIHSKGENSKYGWFKFNNQGQVTETATYEAILYGDWITSYRYDDKGRVVFSSIVIIDDNRPKDVDHYKTDSTVYFGDGGFHTYSLYDDSSTYRLRSKRESEKDTLFTEDIRDYYKSWEKEYFAGNNITEERSLGQLIEDGITYYNSYSTWWTKYDEQGRLFTSGPIDLSENFPRIKSAFKEYGIPDSTYFPYIDSTLGGTIMYSFTIEPGIAIALNDWFRFIWSHPMQGKYITWNTLEYGPFGLTKWTTEIPLNTYIPGERTSKYEFLYDEKGQLIEINRSGSDNPQEKLALIKTLNIAWKNGLPFRAVEKEENKKKVIFIFSYTYW